MSKRVTIECLAEWLQARDDIALLGHVNPDGDAMGSILGIGCALSALGKRWVACLPGGTVKLYGFLMGADAIADPRDGLPFAPKTALAVDVSEPERLGEAGAALFEGCEHRAVLDHHGTNPGFGQLYALDGSAAAAGEMAVELIDCLGVEMSREMAECLFVAVSTDCGNFNYANTTPGALRAAARCVEAGADVSRLTERLYRTRSVARTRLLAEVLSGFSLSEDGRVAWARLTEAMLAETGARREDSEGIINYLLEMEGVMIAVLATEQGGDTKISLRSRPPVSVARSVAMPLGGGGHDQAAGIHMALPLEAALEKVLERALKA